MKSCSGNINSIIISVSKLYYLAITNFTKEKRKSLLKVQKEAKAIHKETKKLKEDVYLTIQDIAGDNVETGHFYVQILDYLKETSNCLQFIINPLFDHVDNNHHPLEKTEADALLKFNDNMSEFFNFALNIIKQQKYNNIDDLKKHRDRLIEESHDIKKQLLKTLKKDGRNTKVSLVFLDILTESKNMTMFVTNVIEANKKFREENNKPK